MTIPDPPFLKFDETSVLNFAYGSNLNPETLRRRKIQPKQIQPVVLEDWRLIFNHHRSYGNIEPVVKSEAPKISTSAHPTEVHGTILELTPFDFRRLTDCEAGYELKAVHLRPYNNRKQVITALAYVVRKDRVAPYRDNLPTDRYMNLIQEGAVAQGLEKEYRDWLASVQSILPRKRSRAESTKTDNDTSGDWDFEAYNRKRIKDSHANRSTVCFSFRDFGKCEMGDNCFFTHEYHRSRYRI